MKRFPCFKLDALGKQVQPFSLHVFLLDSPSILPELLRENTKEEAASSHGAGCQKARKMLN